MKSQSDAPDHGTLLGRLVLDAPIGMALLDEQSRFVCCNQHLAALDGVAVENHLGRTVAEVVPEAWPFVRKHFSRALAGTEVSFEIFSPASDSAEAPAHRWQIVAYPVESANGRLRGVGAVVFDVTEWRRVSAVCDDFLGLVSHQLRTPLTSIIGFAARLARQADHVDRIELREDLQMLLVEAERLRGLLQDLLVCAAGPSEDPFEPYDLRVVIRRAVAQYMATRGTRVKVDLTSQIPPMMGRPTRLEHMLGNLLDNARKFSGADSPIEVGAKQTANAVRLVVRNRGHSLAGDDAELLFEPFTRVERGSSRAPGLGLGLATARLIVAAHGGRIWLQEWEQGVEAVVELPSRVAGASTDDLSPARP